MNDVLMILFILSLVEAGMFALAALWDYQDQNEDNQ